MSALLVMATAIGSVTIYGVIGGVVHAWTHRALGWDTDDGAAFAGVFWPIAVSILTPFLVAQVVSNAITTRLDRPKLPAARVL